MLKFPTKNEKTYFCFTIESNHLIIPSTQDKIEKLKQTLGKHENEKRMLKDDLNKNENRATQMEVHRLKLEGDLQRLQMIMQEKDANMQVCRPACFRLSVESKVEEKKVRERI